MKSAKGGRIYREGKSSRAQRLTETLKKHWKNIVPRWRGRGEWVGNMGGRKTRRQREGESRGDRKKGSVPVCYNKRRREQKERHGAPERRGSIDSRSYLLRGGEREESKGKLN